MSDLKTKNIIITGASGGIGNAIVKRLNDSGAQILASGTRVEKLEQLRALEAGMRIGVAKIAAAPGGVDTAEDLQAVRQRLAAALEG